MMGPLRRLGLVEIERSASVAVEKRRLVRQRITAGRHGKKGDDHIIIVDCSMSLGAYDYRIWRVMSIETS
jgi:hypothetical protein